MSQLHREMRSSHRNVSRSDGRASSKSGLRSPSLKSPNMDAEYNEFDDNLMDMSFMRLDDLLRQKIQSTESLSSTVAVAGSPMSRQESRANSLIGSIIDSEEDTGEAGDDGGVVKIYTVSDVITALGQSRSKINSSSREFLLGELYRMIVKKPLGSNGKVVNETDLESLISFVKTARSGLEFVFSLRSAVAYIASDPDEVATVAVESLFPVLLDKIYSTEETFEGVRSSCLIAYASLLLVIYNESHCYGLENSVETLMELAEGFGSGNLTENDEDIVVNALNAVGVVVSLLYKAGREVNATIQDNIPLLMNFLAEEFTKKVQKTAAVVIALMYEVFDYEEEEEPYHDIDDLKGILTQLVRYSSKKVSKKDKKESRSIFRDVLRSIEKQEHEENDETEVLSRFRLSGSKTLPITSWFEYIRLLHLRYIFGSELNVHYISSREVRSLLAPPDNEAAQYRSADEEYQEHDKAWKSETGRLSSIKKDQKIREARERKLREQLGDLALE
ncbi:hypothetical protein KL905_000094 [Ogataea polymorpha]|uniref:Interferon-related developmental regulator N-terminal domain-containing protein n=1 Tax=Ogataea polymorpha TaxID=460523 RepID=A0A9P8P1X7_9ASCO|nr:hypothetical protein KL906_000672 [Ogataea polymorpha]KAG7912816.1 hypothetical protein KL907_001018 [Ogataea polymorpha]KAG7923940.1 hypothetical protein KL905_000094 [Ogataea polymorpha]KAG7937012.1 hypothetical protein KL934_001215 [Ogataea polymorpha]KAH3663179.1 hypothetical protein OGATHE_004755 [Ogataea polymorpha]